MCYTFREPIFSHLELIFHRLRQFSHLALIIFSHLDTFSHIEAFSHLRVPQPIKQLRYILVRNGKKYKQKFTLLIYMLSQ